jgi:hypothetical protein
MTGTETRELEDGSTVYSGTLAAGKIARESGFKEGYAIRGFPSGCRPQRAADPSAPLDTAVTVGPDRIVRVVVVTSGKPAWRYDVAYSHLGDTPAPTAPPNARSLER